MRRDVEPGFAWQPSFYEHIIRNDRDLARVRAYIHANPANWLRDADNPATW